MITKLKIYQKPPIEGNDCVRIFEKLYDCAVFPGRITFSWNDKTNEGWAEIHPNKISITFEAKFKSFDELSKFLEKMKTSYEFVQAKKEIDVSSKIGKIYKEIIDLCKTMTTCAACEGDGLTYDGGNKCGYCKGEGAIWM